MDNTTKKIRGILEKLVFYVKGTVCGRTCDTKVWDKLLKKAEKAIAVLIEEKIRKDVENVAMHLAEAIQELVQKDKEMEKKTNKYWEIINDYKRELKKKAVFAKSFIHDRIAEAIREANPMTGDKSFDKAKYYVDRIMSFINEGGREYERER